MSVGRWSPWLLRLLPDPPPKRQRALVAASQSSLAAAAQLQLAWNESVLAELHVDCVHRVRPDLEPHTRVIWRAARPANRTLHRIRPTRMSSAHARR